MVRRHWLRCEVLLPGQRHQAGPPAGIALAEELSPAEKLKEVQKLMEQDNPHAAAIYRSIGVYLGHTLAFYYDLYHCRHVLLLGRVMSGKGGDIILDTCKKVLADEYPELAGKITPELPTRSSAEWVSPWPPPVCPRSDKPTSAAPVFCGPKGRCQ